jgi:hypothetical protein
MNKDLYADLVITGLFLKDMLKLAENEGVNPETHESLSNAAEYLTSIRFIYLCKLIEQIEAAAAVTCLYPERTCDFRDKGKCESPECVFDNRK